MKTNIFAIAALSGSLFAASLSTAAAQDKAPAQAFVVSYIEVAPANAVAARATLRALRKTTLKESGNEGFEVLQRIDRPPHFVVIETWKDAKAQSEHVSSPATKEARDKLKPMLVAPYDERPSFGFIIGSPRQLGTRTVYAVTHVDFVGAKKDDGLAALKVLSTESEKEPGRQRFDILQQSNRPNHITLIEGWRGMSAFQAHEAAAPSRKFRDALLPIGGALFDQRLYRAVD